MRVKMDMYLKFLFTVQRRTSFLRSFFSFSPSISIESPTGHGRVVATIGLSEIEQIMPSMSSASLDRDHGA